LERQNATLKAQTESLRQQQGQLTAPQEKIAANKAAIGAAIARFGQLDDYYILDEMTVYFDNGKVTIDPQYQTELLKLASSARIAPTLLPISWCSTATSRLTNVLAPGAMGETRQVGDDKTAGGLAQNRRVVVGVLQNKGSLG
jgi:outer membrane protein OmpA-like peptidoglycan-associated protein